MFYKCKTIQFLLIWKIMFLCYWNEKIRGLIPFYHLNTQSNGFLNIPFFYIIWMRITLISTIRKKSIYRRKHCSTCDVAEWIFPTVLSRFDEIGGRFWIKRSIWRRCVWQNLLQHCSDILLDNKMNAQQQFIYLIASCV